MSEQKKVLWLAHGRSHGKLVDHLRQLILTAGPRFDIKVSSIEIMEIEKEIEKQTKMVELLWDALNSVENILTNTKNPFYVPNYADLCRVALNKASEALKEFSHIENGVIVELSRRVDTQVPTQVQYLKVIEEWKHAWMHESDYFERAFGIDANMKHDLARRLVRMKQPEKKEG